MHGMCRALVLRRPSELSLGHSRQLYYLQANTKEGMIAMYIALQCMRRG